MFGCKFFGVLLSTALLCQITGDVIISRNHEVNRCVHVSNLSQFPDIILVGVYSPSMLSTELERYVLQEDSCLKKINKRCSFAIFWAEKKYFTETGIDNLPIGVNTNGIISENQCTGTASCPFAQIPMSVELNGSLVPDSTHIKAEVLEYKVVTTSTGTGYTLYLASITTSYDDRSDKVENFSNTTALMSKRIEYSKSVEMVQVSFGQGCLLVSSLYNGKIHAKLLDCRGSVVSTFERLLETGKHYTIPCTGISNGIYWLQVKSADKKIAIPLNLIEKN